MTPENFTTWLEGFIDLTNGSTPTPQQWQIIRDHLQEVFTKTTPFRYETNGVLPAMQTC